MLFQMGALIAGGILIALVLLIVGILLSGLFLMITARLFKLKDKTYKTALIAAAIVGIVGFVIGFIPVPYLGLIISILLGIYLVKQFYKVDWNKAAIVGIVWFVINWVVMFLLGFLLGAGLMAAV